ncbi:MAG: hypothetical protein GY722_19820 [bacterium]|nr:hypothetical protein [bacterium]
MRKLEIILLLCVLGACARNYTSEEPATFCEVHKVDLEIMDVPFSYGMGSGYADAPDEEQFPHARNSVNCGCVVGSCENFVFRRARVKACPQCNRAEDEWREEYFATLNDALSNQPSN